MPGLKLVLRAGTYYIRGTVKRQSVYESTGTSDPDRAEALRAKREAELWDRSVYGPQAVVRFAEAVDSYLDAHPASKTTAVLILRLMKHFDGVLLRDIDQSAVDRAYRVLLRPNAGPATKLRGVLTPLRAILEHAARRRWCERPAFETPRVPKTRTPFLRPAEATALVQAASPHLRPLLVFLIATGCRMSEALELEWSKVDLAGARAVVIQKQGTERHVDLPPVAVAALAALPHRTGRLFRPARHNSTRLGVAYRDTGRTGGGQIKTAWASACQRAGLPGEMREWKRKDRPGKVWRRFAPEHTPHCLRHTWATAHYCIHKDLLKLRTDGGWETVDMVERYAHVLPDIYAAEWKLWYSGGPAMKRASG